MSTEPWMKFKEKYPNEPQEAYKTSANYDAVPSIAFLHGTAIYGLAASWGMRYIFAGGEDGFVRKYDFYSSINDGQLLTASQRHMLPDTIAKLGVLSAYWENEQPLREEEYKVAGDGTYIPRLSPVYSLAAEAEALWVASGLESGGISIQSATYGEMGQCLAYLDGHNKTVSDLKLNGPEDALLSGSWDKSVALWDLNAGVLSQKYSDLSSQVSCIDWQPIGAMPVSPPKRKEAKPNGDGDGDEDDDKSMESLFGSDDDEAQAGEKVKEEQNRDENPSENDVEQSSQEKDTEETDKPNTGNVFLSACYNGCIEIWDRRQATRASWLAGSQSPPWCISSCFSYDGNHIFAGRRNACVEDYDLRNCDEPLRQLKFPAISGAVSCVESMPNNRSLLCASFDNIRMYDLNSERKTPFYIIPGHHGTIVSRMIVDRSGKYFVSACGGRGWVDSTSDATLAYDISPE